MARRLSMAEELARRDPRESKLMKKLGEQVKDDAALIRETADLLDSNDKNIRTGAMGVLREVAAKKPGAVIRHLDRIIEALMSRKEKPTRWIATDICAYCAHLEPAKIERAVPCIARQMVPKEGTVLMVQSARFMGRFGGLDNKKALSVFPHLEKALETYPQNAVGFVMESLEEIAPMLDDRHRGKVKALAEGFLEHPRPATRKKTTRLLDTIEKLGRG